MTTEQEQAVAVGLMLAVGSLSAIWILKAPPHRWWRRGWCSAAVGAFFLVMVVLVIPDSLHPLMPGAVGVVGGLLAMLRSTLEKRGVL